MDETPRIIITAHDGTALGDLDPTQLIGLLAISEVNGENAMQVTTTQELTKGDRLLWRDGRGYWHEYVVEGAEAPHDTPGGPIHTYYCPWSVQHDLEGTSVTGMPGTGGTPATATQALTAALAGTARWAVGTVGIGTTGSASFWRMSGWEAMQELVSVWGGEVQASITVGATGVTARAVDLLTHVGSASATRRFDYGEDMRGITRTVSDELWTPRVIPLGAGEETESGGYGRKITIESVNGGVAYLENADVTSMTRVPDGNGGWEYPVQTVENPDCDTPSDLLAWAQANLDTWTTPKVSYEADVVQLARAGMDTLGVSLGDEVAIVDKTFGDSGLRIQGRVLRIEEDLLDPTATVLTISNLRDSLASTLESLARATADVRDMVTGMSANQSSAQWVSDLLSRINAEANATGGYTYITEGQGIRCYDVAVTDPLVGAEASAVCEIKGGTMRIANTKDSGGNWQWKTVFTSGRILAELIDAIGASSGYHAQLTPTGLDVYDGADVIAHFGSTVTIGQAADQHIGLTSDGFIVYTDDGAHEAVRIYGEYDTISEIAFSDRKAYMRAIPFDVNGLGIILQNGENEGASADSRSHSIEVGVARYWSSDHSKADSAGITMEVDEGGISPSMKMGVSSDSSGIQLEMTTSASRADLLLDGVGVYPTHGKVGQDTSIAANSYHDYSVSFGHTYASAPNVQLTIYTTSTATTFDCDIYLTSVSTTGFTARIFNRENASRSPGFHWKAIG